MKNINKLKLSIAMATYNGSRYISEQLQSLANQTIKPYEIVICDDCSKDNTVEIIENFKRSSGLNIKVFVNHKNLGVIKNFERAISLTSGDIIFISDQDDYWFSNKLEAYVDAFEKNPDVDFVFSDLQISDKDLNPLSGSLFTPDQKNHPEKYVGSNLINTISFVSMKIAASGATIAFRSEITSYIIPIPEIKQLLHDGWIGRIAASTSKCLLLPKPYSKYRQHCNNVDGYKGSLSNKINDIKNLYQFRQQEYDFLNIVKERLISLNFDNKSKIIDIISRKQFYLSKQILLYSQHRILRNTLLIFQYMLIGVFNKYYRGSRTFSKELLALLINNFKL